MSVFSYWIKLQSDVHPEEGPGLCVSIDRTESGYAPKDRGLFIGPFPSRDNAWDNVSQVLQSGALKWVID
jgi:hypothetical protein